MSTYTQIRDAQEKLATQGEHLGTLMWWSLAENRISHLDLNTLASAQGLDPKYLPAEIKPLGAFKRAVSHQGTLLDKGHMLRTISDNKNEFIVAVVFEKKDEVNKDLRYTILAKMTFRKGTGTFTSDVDHPVVQSINNLYQVHLDHHTDDVRTMMTDFLRVSGVSLRQAGGVYFVPSKFQGTLDALCHVVEKCSSSNATYQLRVFDTQEAKETLAKVAQAGLEEEIRQVQEQLDKFAFERARESTLAKKLEGFEELKAKAKMFAEVLNFKAEAITARIDKIKRVVSGHLEPEPVKTFEEDPKMPGQGIFSPEAGF